MPKSNRSTARRFYEVFVAFLCAVLVAALAFPSPVFAATAGPDARTRGKIQIRYSKEGQTFEVYRLFDIVIYDEGESRQSIGASANLNQLQDEDRAAPQPESYDFVIRQTLPVNEGETRDNPWWSFLTTYGPDGKDSATPYAILSTERDEKKIAAAYFVIDNNAVTLGDASDYHVVAVLQKFARAPEIDTTKFVGTSEDSAGEQEASTSAEAKMVQDFVQSALGYVASQELTRSQGHYTAFGREATGVEITTANTRTDVYQYSGDNAYVDNVPLGYYLLGTTTGAVCALSDVAPTALVYDRNEQPELFVQTRAKHAAVNLLPYAQMSEEDQYDLLWSEDHLRGWSYKTSANLGELVQYKTVIIATQGVTDYCLHDVMEKGLTLVDEANSSEATGMYDDAGLQTNGTYDYSPRVYLYSRATDTTYDIPSKLGDNVNWTFHKAGDKNDEDAPRDGCDFEVEFQDSTQELGGDEGKQKMTFAYVDPNAPGATDAIGKTSKADAAKTDAAKTDAAKTDTSVPADSAIKNIDVMDWDRIIVTYWAKVTDDATIYGSDKTVEQVEAAGDLSTISEKDGAKETKLPVQTHTDTDGNNRNTNSAVLTYGNGSHTTWARAEVSTYQFDVVKTGEASDEQSTVFPLLEGAEFSLHKSVEKGTEGAAEYTATVNGSDKTYYYYLSDAAVTFSQDGDTYTYLDEAKEDADKSTTSLAALGKGSINVRGIEAGTYMLVEEEAPEGCVKLRDPVVVTIHDEPYTNTDIVEDNNPGSRHSNAEGDVTVTSVGQNGIMRRDVFPWGTTTDATTYNAKDNGGVHVINFTRDIYSNGKAIIVVVVALLMAAGAGTIALFVIIRRRA